jgi:Homeodomain-like domain-containing protein
VWRSGSEIAAAVRLSDAGHSDREVARATGIPHETVRAWRSGRVPQRARRVLAGLAECDGCGGPEHDLSALPREAYAYLLGMYLGDGCVARTPKGGCSLRISLDATYPGIIASAREAVAAVKGRPLPHLAPHGAAACVVITSYWKAWPCLLPQHGPGRKHDRPIVLEPWQEKIVGDAPQAFLRALIHTDGWRGTNRVRVKGREYAYPRYQFSNRSDDIRRLFTDACDRLGVAWRPWGPFHVSVARRDAVARLDAFIGPKA